MKNYSLSMIDSYTAVGGYKAEDITKSMRSEGYGPTSAGLYTIHTIEPHKSFGRWTNSVVPWKAETKIENKNVVKVLIGGKWINLSSLKGWQGSDKDAYQALLESYDDLFNDGMIAGMMRHEKLNRVQLLKQMGIGHIASSPLNREIPSKWMLNDFGHKSIKYFVDRDNDGVLDKGEKQSAEFIHSSPHTEVWNSLELLARTKIKEKALSRYPWAGTDDKFYRAFDIEILDRSHGCIHAFPDDIDKMLNKGYLKKRSLVQVHKYGEKSGKLIRVRRARTLEYEVHFYPTDFKIIVYRTQRLSSENLGKPLNNR